MDRAAVVFPENVARFLRGLCGYRWMTFEEMARRVAITFNCAPPSVADVATYLGRALKGKCGLNRLVRDPEQAAWLACHSAHMTTDELRAGAVDLFGPDRAASRTAIHRHLKVSSPLASTRRKTRIDRDPEVRAVVRQLAGTMPVAAIFVELQHRFPAERVPSRAALYRHVSALLSTDALRAS